MFAKSRVPAKPLAAVRRFPSGALPLLMTGMASVGLFGGLFVGTAPAQGRSEPLNPAPVAAVTNLAPETNVQVLAPVEVVAKRPVRDDAAAKAWKKLVQLHEHPSMPIASIIGFASGEALKYVLHIDDREDMTTNVVRYLGGIILPLENKLADQSRDFYTRFPGSTNAIRAQVWEYKALGDSALMEQGLARIERARKIAWRVTAQKMAYTNTLARLLPAEAALAAATNLPAESRSVVRQCRLDRLAAGPVAGFLNAQPSLPAEIPTTGPLADFLDQVLALQRDYPAQAGSYKYLPWLIEWMDGNQARTLATNLLAGPAPEKAKQPFRDYLQRTGWQDKRLTIHFPMADGKKADSSQMKGKVVLISFLSPGDVEFRGPELKLEQAVYRKFHARGFEIIDICLTKTNQVEDLADEFKQAKIPWPVDIDGDGRKGALARQFGIFKTPTLFLLDKQGVLRETRIRNGPRGRRDALNWGIADFTDSDFEPVDFLYSPQTVLWDGLEDKIKELLAEP